MIQLRCLSFYNLKLKRVKVQNSSLLRIIKNIEEYFSSVLFMNFDLTQKKLASITGLETAKPIDANSLHMKLKNYTNCIFIYVIDYILHLTIVNNNAPHLTIVNNNAPHLTVINNNFFSSISASTNDSQQKKQ